METQATVLQYYRVNSRNERWIMRLEAIQEKYYYIAAMQCKLFAFCFTAIFWSGTPSIFNIKAQGLAHCLRWIKLS